MTKHLLKSSSRSAAGTPRSPEMLGIDVSRVYRFTYPKDRGGSDGRIPSRHQQELLDAATERGRNLQPADFFREEPMRKKPLPPAAPSRYPNPANLASRLRRIRNELSLMTQACDDALERLDRGGDGDPDHQRTA